MKKKDVKKKRKPRKKATNQNTNTNTQVVHIHNPAPVKRKYSRKPKAQSNDKFSVPTTGESLIFNLLSRFQPQQQSQQDYAQLKSTPEPSPSMPHEASEVASDLTYYAGYNISRFLAEGSRVGYRKKDDVSYISEDDRKSDELSRFSDDISQISNYDNLQSSGGSSFEKGGGGGGGVSQSDDETSDGGGGGGTPPKSKKKRNNPINSPFLRSKRWKDFSYEALIREIDKYNSRKSSKQNDSNKKSANKELVWVVETIN